MTSPLRAKREALESLWRQGVSGQALLREHSKLVDEFIRDCFLETDLAGLSESFSLVALGGYGREELFPYSDIDLMILFRPEFETDVGQVTDAVLYPLWDTGLEVGHGVRTIDDAMALADEDFYFKVSMLDARLLTGSQMLFFELLSAFRGKYIEGQRKEFVVTMEKFRGERREKYGSHSYLLEPHIKEGKGGMRDIQAMLWTAKVVYGLEGINGIVNAGILTAEEHEGFNRSWDMLVRIRNRLHYVSKRKNDQLYFEQQEEIAEALGYKDTTSSLAVEQFMGDMYAHMQNIAVVTDLFFEHVGEVLGFYPGEKKVADRQVEKGIEIRNNSVHLIASEENIAAKPHLLIRLFLAAARYDLPVYHRSKKVVSANLKYINDKVRVSSRAVSAFLAILESDGNLADVLGAMLETGLLTSFIPEFERVHTLAQHDLYHIYTVDRHSIQTMDELHRVMADRDDVVEMVSAKRVLSLAALLHDVGKGSGKDHSTWGAELAREIGMRMGFSDEECDDLHFVILHHLYMPENALRRDLNDSEFIKNCAIHVGTANRLAMLYLLSIADSKATGPSAWSDWKAALLSEMFFKVKPYLENDRFDHVQADLVESRVEKDIQLLRQQVTELFALEKELKVTVDDLAPDYLLSFSPEEVARHARLHRDNASLLQKKSRIYAEEKDGQWALLIMTKDRPGLLAKICGIMTLHNLSVLNAQIFTWGDGTVVDVLDVRPTDGLMLNEKDWEGLNRELDLAIMHRLGLSHRLYRKLAVSPSRQKELVTRRKPQILIDNDTSSVFTIVEVHGSDSPGQLYRITQTLADFGINIYKAFIATEVEQLIDVFYVLDKDKLKIEDADYKIEIREGLLYAISRNGDKN